MGAKLLRAALLFAPLALVPAQALPDDAGQATLRALEKIAAGAHRSEANRARDRYRHPVETLSWLGIRDDMTVVELSPGEGWYTEILAPFLRERGTFYAASYDPESKVEYYRNTARSFSEKLAATPALYDEVIVTVLEVPDKLAIAPDGSADLVLTFRNLHNWMEEGQAERVLRAAHRALKPGGTLGLVQHRAKPGAPQDPAAKSGYVDPAFAIALAEAAGFTFAGSSEINANPADTKNYAEGVWTLPPTLTLEEVDRERYVAIGESDRMTLKFVKPAAR